MVDILQLLFFHFGAYDADGTCNYFINPLTLYYNQPQCSFDYYLCSHLAAAVVYAAALMEKCVYKYYQCPPFYGYSIPHSGLTRMNCADHPSLKRTCISTSLFPIRSC